MQKVIAAADDDPDQVARVVSGLVRDGLLRRHDRLISLAD